MFDNITPANNDFPPKTILLAEDDASVRRFIEIILQRADYQVLTAADGLEAMKIAMENQVDAVVADAMMPNLTGFDLCRILRQNLSYQNVPFIILSGFDQNAEQYQADAFLTKGEHLKNELLEILSTLLFSKELATN